MADKNMATKSSATTNTDQSLTIGRVTSAWANAQGLKTFYFPETTSTNLIAKEKAFDDEVSENDGVLFIADLQTAGRGRFDRKWETTKAGASLLSTWSFAINAPPRPEFTLRVGLALITALRATWPFLDFKLKAPNDILVNGQKLAGLLVETVSQGAEHRLLIGLGINVLAHPAGMSTATHLLAELTRAKCPFVGDDWLLFCERLFFELSATIPDIENDWSETTKTAIRYFINPSQSFEEILEEMERL